MKLFSFISLFAGALSCCTKQADCPRYFQIPAQITPLQTEYRIGDTIRIVSRFYKKVTAFNSEEKEIGTFDMTGIKWKPVTTLFRTDTVQQAGKSSLAQYFEYIKDPGYDYGAFYSSNNANGLNGAYRYSNDTFSLEIKLITKRTGVFLLRQESAVLAGPGEQQDFPGRCGNNGFDVWVKMNDGANNNLDLLKASPDVAWQQLATEDPERNFYRWGGYCFKVLPK